MTIDEAIISIHTPAWGATVKQKTWQYRHLFQSTLPRGERPVDCTCTNSGITISIHTPAWGATMYSGYQGAYIEISIHTPAWGATH